MLWAFIATALTGFLAGCRLRAGALVLLSAATYFLMLITAWVLSWSVLWSLGMAFALTLALQFSYLLGATAAYGHRRKIQARACRHDAPSQNAGVSEPTS